MSNRLTFQGVIHMSLILILLVMISGSSILANRCVAKDTMTVWKHDKGLFRKPKHSNIWLEYNSNYELVATFKEISRSPEGIIMHDDERGLSILLRSDVSGIKTEEEANFQQLYHGSFTKVADCSEEG
ncbi:unnamed protein product [Phytomonas sp. Hart1]|nr:unnamed protein product [Phytomonas sp. Hart1]|eukprot:CCW70350.1 unnamed protein product [Phytomonas sp. isolate Hart1]